VEASSGTGVDALFAGDHTYPPSKEWIFTAPEIIQLNEFNLDVARYELRCGDRVLKLEKNPMELLILLVESQGRLVTREEIT